MSGDELAALLYLSTSHADAFVRCACAARALELRGRPVTAAAVARTAKVSDRKLARDVAAWATESEPMRVKTRSGRWKAASAPGAARRSVMAGVVEGLLDLGPYAGAFGSLRRSSPPRALPFDQKRLGGGRAPKFFCLNKRALSPTAPRLRGPLLC